MMRADDGNMLDDTNLELAGPDPAEILRRVFGHPGFRGRQEEIIRHVVAGGSGLVLMPTGGGKSLCYQVPALCREGLTVVVSPLIALMEDQVAAMRQQGIPAAALHSDLDEDAAREVRRGAAGGGGEVVYISPARGPLETGNPGGFRCGRGVSGTRRGWRSPRPPIRARFRTYCASAPSTAARC